MIRIISLDMDGTLVSTRFVDLVWEQGIPGLYAEKNRISLEEARKYVVGEYMKIGSARLEWYDLQYWIDKFQLSITKDDLLRTYDDEVEPYPEVQEVLELLSQDYGLVVTSNAAREFIEIELEDLAGYFRETFSATTDFREVKKSPLLYGAVCAHLDARPYEVLHIGDQGGIDRLLEGAQAVGGRDHAGAEDFMRATLGACLAMSTSPM